MHRIALLLISVLLASSVTAADQSSTETGRTYIKAGRMLDAAGGRILSDRVITIAGDRVEAVGDSGTAIPPDAQPGLIDMHTHLLGYVDSNYFNNYFLSPHRAVIGGVVHAERTLMAGFTTVRNVGAADYQDVALRDSIDAGEVPGPRLRVSGPGLGITGGHCDENSLNHSFGERADGVADGPWAVREMVRRNVKYGVDLIKFCATGGVFSKGTVAGQTQYTLEEMQAIVDEAHTHGRKVAAHAHGTDGIRRAIEAGADSIEHASYLDEETIRLAKKQGTWLAMDIYNTEYTLAEGEANGVPAREGSRSGYSSAGKLRRGRRGRCPPGLCHRFGCLPAR